MIDIVIALLPGTCDSGIYIVSSGMENNVQGIQRAGFLVFRMENGKGIILRRLITVLRTGGMMEKRQFPAKEQSIFRIMHRIPSFLWKFIFL